MAGSLILLITYGINVQSVDNPFLIMVEKAMETLAVAGNPGAFLVDTLPIRTVSFALLRLLLTGIQLSTCLSGYQVLGSKDKPKSGKSQFKRPQTSLYSL